MRNIFPPVVTYALCFLLALSFAAAATAKEQTAGIEPDSLLHSLDLAWEKVQLIFIFSSAKRADFHLSFAAERLAEAQDMAEKGKNDLAESSVDKYQNELHDAETELDTAKADGEKLDVLVAKIGKSVKKNTVILTSLLDKVPDTAKSSIQNALDNSAKTHEKALAAIGKKIEKTENKKEEQAKEEKTAGMEQKNEEAEKETTSSKEKVNKKKQEKEEEKGNSPPSVDPDKYSYAVRKFEDHAEISGRVNGREVKFRIESDQYSSDTALKLRIVREVSQLYGFSKEDAQNAMANLKIEWGTKSEIPLVKKKKNY